MRDQDKTRAQLISELEELRSRVGALEAAAAQGKHAESELRHEHQLAQQYLDVAGVIVVVLDNGGNIRLLNPKGHAVLGYDDEELLGKNWFDICLPQRIRDEVKSVFGELAAGRMALAEYHDNPVLTKSGEERIIAWHNAVLRDDNGAVVGTLGSGLDITDRKLIEQALKEAYDELERRVAERTAELQHANEQLRQEVDKRRRAEATLDAFFRESTAILNIVDQDFRYLKTDRLTPTYFGLDSQSIVGKSCKDLAPQFVQEYGPMVRRVIETGEPANNVETRTLLSSRPGEMAYWRASYFPLALPEGKRGYGVVGVEITDIKRAEEALRQSECRFRNYFEQGLIGMAVTSVDKRWLEVNDRLCEILGYPREELVQTDWVRLTHPDDIEPNLRLFNPLLAGEIQHFTLDKRYLKKDGSVVYTTIHTRAFRKDDGTIDHIVTLIEDITARKQAEAALQASEEKYRILVEASPEGVVMADLRGHVTFASHRLLEMYGSDRAEELIGKPPLDLIARKDHQRFLGNLRRTVEEGLTRDIEYEFLRKDGTPFAGEISTAVVKDADGKSAALVGIVKDIRQRKRAEEVLRTSEERYELAVRGAGVGIFDWNILTGKVYYSPRWKTLFGYDESDIGDGVEDWSRLLHPDERDSIIKRQDDFFASTATTVTAEYRLRHKDNSYRWIVAHALVVRDKTGRACRLVGSHGDITDRKFAEEAVERERQSLWNMLQASDHERQVISYEIHDGLAQYLGGAIMQFQAHESLLESSPHESQKAYETAVELVRQAHFESRRLISEVRPPVIDEIGLETAVSHLVQEQRRRGGPKLELRSSVQFGRLPAILENSLYRIAQEALTNACKHAKSKKVKIGLAQEGQEVRLEVQDWGIGFDPEAVEKGHFGLEGIRQRVRLLGGRLKIESKPGSGTLVQAVVPIVERQGEL